MYLLRYSVPYTAWRCGRKREDTSQHDLWREARAVFATACHRASRGFKVQALEWGGAFNVSFEI